MVIECPGPKFLKLIAYAPYDFRVCPKTKHNLKDSSLHDVNLSALWSECVGHDANIKESRFELGLEAPPAIAIEENIISL